MAMHGWRFPGCVMGWQESAGGPDRIKRMNMDVKTYMQQLGQAAREASRATAEADTHAKNLALVTIAQAIRREKAALLKANQAEVESARNNGARKSTRLNSSN